MVFERSSLRYAHTNGYTSLTYTEDGDFILTCGSDGDLRKWRGIDDDDPTSSCLGEFVNCIVHSGSRLLASTDCNTVQAYTFPSMDSDGTLLRFTAPVTCLRVHHKYTAAGSEDTLIKVLKNEETKIELHLQGHSGPLLGLDMCAKGALLASAGGDGLLKIWNLEKDGMEVKSIGGLPQANSFENAVCYGTPTFEPQHSKALAYVCGKEVLVLSTTSWEVQCRLTDERISGEYTCCRFSRDGQYLAAGTTAGDISVFDFVRKLALKTDSPASECQAITCIAWSPTNNELAYCDNTGQLGTLKRTDGCNDGVGSVAFAQAEGVDFGDIEFGNDANNADCLKHKTTNCDVDGSDDGNSDGDDGDGISLEKLKRRVMRSAESYASGEVPSEENSRDLEVQSAHGAAEPSPYVRVVKQQSPFQPGSTPLHLEHRYLVWNDVGIVTAHADSADGAIDVEFHDASVHHALHIPNHSGHTMASLSPNVLALAAAGGTKLVCIALAASGNREWCVQLPDCEGVEALAATTRLVGVATTMQFLRLFTVLGTQREVLSIPGPVLAIAGRDDRLLVCYHSAPPGEQQYLAALLVQVDGSQLRVQQLPVPIPGSRQLSWLGFTDCGSPVFSDSMGLLQLYNMRSGCWHPVCDTLKHSQSVSNNYFVVGVSEHDQTVQAVLCRASSYPMTNPRPMTQELSMLLPLCDAELEKSQLENQLVRASIMSVNGADQIVKETAVKLFALACRSEVEMRAKELVEMIARADLLQLAIKYATKLGRIHLSEQLEELRQQIEEPSTQSLQNVSLSPLMRSCTPTYGVDGGGGSKLAPKSMELTQARRASLKRFAMSNTPTTNTRKSTAEATVEQAAASMATSNTEFSDTQENVFAKGSEMENSERNKAAVTRTPFNSVNPFAAKRKLADADIAHKGGILMGSAKLKLAKK